MAKQKGIEVFLDTYSQAFIDAIAAKPNMIKPNEDEACEYLQWKFRRNPKLKKYFRHLGSEVKCKKALDVFHEEGIKIVLISLGKKGAIGSNGQEQWYAKVPDFKIKNSVGCGDAFVGGFLNARFKKKSFKDCLSAGVACGSANALHLIPGRFNKGDLKRLIKNIKLKPLNEKG